MISYGLSFLTQTADYSNTNARRAHFQDCKALLNDKYCPRVAAVSCTQKHTKNACDLDL